MMKAIEHDKTGLIKKIIHEEEEHEAQKKELSPKSKKNRFFMFISVLFIVLALIMLLFVAFKVKNVKTVQVVPKNTSLILNDQTDFKEIAGFGQNRITETVLNQVNNTKVDKGEIEGIFLTENKKIIGFKRFITLIKSNLSEEEAAFFNENFLLGAFNDGLNSVSSQKGSSAQITVGDFFMLLKINSFTEVFSVMQAWENKILYDLHGFLGVDISPDTNYLFTKNFEDGVIQNKNARILYDKDGNIVLMYVFIDNNYIVVTKSEEAVKEIILRLAASKIRK